jgi:hypothetical protein
LAVLLTITPDREENVSLPQTSEPDIADDLLKGAEEIAVFLFGSPDDKRKVYMLTSEVPPEKRLPIFKLGDSVIYARKSTLRRWIEEKERAARAANSVPNPVHIANSVPDPQATG